MPHGVGERLFPGKDKFFAAFGEVAARLARAAALLAEGFDNPARLPEIAATVRAVDREADEALHALDLRVDRLLIAPMDQEDIHLLSSRLRRAVDAIGGTARRAVSLGAVEHQAPAVQLARMLARAAREIDAAVLHLRDRQRVLEHCRTIKQAEEEGDAIWEAAITGLFAGTPDALNVLRWKALYDQLQDALDACDDVANELETITLKQA